MKMTQCLVLAAMVLAATTTNGCDPYVEPETSIDCQALDRVREVFIISQGTQVPVLNSLNVLGELRDGSILVSVVGKGEAEFFFPDCDVRLLVEDQEAAAALILETFPDEVGGVCIKIAGGPDYHGYDPELSPANTYVVDCADGDDEADLDADGDTDEDDEEEESGE